MAVRGDGQEPQTDVHHASFLPIHPRARVAFSLVHCCSSRVPIGLVSAPR